MENKNSSKVKDIEYHNELVYEISVKNMQANLALQQVSFLNGLLELVKQGRNKEEIKANLEHDPFKDFDFFGMQKSISVDDEIKKLKKNLSFLEEQLDIKDKQLEDKDKQVGEFSNIIKILSESMNSEALKRELDKMLKK
jgi:hypothetical protein